MNIRESLDIFGILNINEVTEQSLKSIYKKLMIKYHPDNCNGDEDKAKDISTAYRIVKEAIKKIEVFEKVNGQSKVKRDIIVLSLDNLAQLYRDKELVFKHKINKDDVRRYTMRDIVNNGALVLVEWSIKVNGVTNEYSSICAWNKDDKYQVNCDIYVEDINKECSILVNIANKEKMYNIKSQNIRLNLLLDPLIYVEVMINKKIRN